MGIKKYFLDNLTYGADDVNDAFSHLVGEGVTSFSNGENLNGSLDLALSDIVTEGVDASGGCKVSVNSGVYKVGEGVCFLSDGTHIAVDSNGYVLDVTEGQESYVYVYHSASDNTLGIYVSPTQGASGSVPLAKINANGSITDMRKFAVSKVALNVGNTYIENTFSIPRLAEDEEYSAEYELGFAGFNYVLWDYMDGRYNMVTPLGSSPVVVFRYTSSPHYEIWLQKQGSKVVITTSGYRIARNIRLKFI